MKSTTRPTRTRATYRRSDSADTTDAAKARQRLKRNDDRAESIAQERRIGPEPGATVRASVRAGSHGYGKTRPDDGAKSRRRGRWTAERIVLECPISFRSCPQRRPSRCSFTTVAPPQRRWTGDSTAQSKGKRGSPARAGTTRLFLPTSTACPEVERGSAVFRPPIHATAVASASNPTHPASQPGTPRMNARVATSRRVIVEAPILGNCEAESGSWSSTLQERLPFSSPPPWSVKESSLACLDYVWSFAMFDSGGRLIHWLVFTTNHWKGLFEMKKAMWKADRSGRTDLGAALLRRRLQGSLRAA